MAFFRLIKGKGGVIAAEKLRVTSAGIDVFAGGSGGALAYLDMVMKPADMLYAKLLGQPRLVYPEAFLADLDAGARGLDRAVQNASRLNVLADSDKDGVAFGRVRSENLAISANMAGPKGEDTSISDMIPPEDENARMMMDSVMTAEESMLERKVGGQGRAKLVAVWSSDVMKTERVREMKENIRKRYMNGEKILLRVIGGVTGATGPTFLLDFVREIYNMCLETKAQYIDNLNIHLFVLMGYAKHPGDSEGGAFALDPMEDDYRISNWFSVFEDSGVVKMTDRVYFISAPPAICYEFFARGGDQGRHFSLGDLLCLAAMRDSEETAFDSAEDGFRFFVPKAGDDPRFGWSAFESEELKRVYVNYLRFCAGVWLKLRPLTNVSHEEVRVAPHVVRLLGKNAPSDELESKIIKPIQAMVGLAGEALAAFRDIGATGTDFSQQPVAYTGGLTTLFNPYAIQKILDGGVEPSRVNLYNPIILTQYDKGSGTANSVKAGCSLGEAYSRAANSVSVGDSAAEFLYEFYSALAI